MTPKERPILFSGPMVKAILEGEKTQTRRVIKPQPEYLQPDGTIKRLEELPIESQTIAIRARLPRYCPYGKPGDRLWVRETWFQNGRGEVLYRADYGPESYEGGAKGWKPSIHMPRWACRLVLEIANVRVERLQDISTYDAMDEGVGKPRYSQFEKGSHLVGAFRDIWNEINGKRGFGWDANPWVWAITFKRIAP